jgi:hypothetical protein
MLQCGRRAAQRVGPVSISPLKSTRRRTFAIKIGLLQDLTYRGLIADVTRSELGAGLSNISTYLIIQT